MLAMWVRSGSSPRAASGSCRRSRSTRSAPRATSPAASASTCCKDQEDPNVYYFYEVYRDEAALEEHRAAPHYAVWRAAADTLDGPAQATRTRTVFPAAADYWSRTRIAPLDSACWPGQAVRFKRASSRANSKRSCSASSSGSQFAMFGNTTCHIRASRSGHGMRSAARAVPAARAGAGGFFPDRADSAVAAPAAGPRPPRTGSLCWPIPEQIRLIRHPRAALMIPCRPRINS